MPRTKRVRSVKPVEDKVYHSPKVVDIILKRINEEEERICASIDNQMQKDLEVLKISYMEIKTKIPKSLFSVTIKAIENGEAESILGSTIVLSDLTNTLNHTKSVVNSVRSDKNNTSQMRKKRSISSSTDSNITNLNVTRVIPKERASRARSKRSISVGCEDEGDRRTRQSRSKVKAALSKPISRSLSRMSGGSKLSYKTPANKQIPPNDSGTITPKCKLNTPQLFLRRPKMGETAWSNQGSPLMLGPVAPEQQANVNIPLPDGNLMSLLPQRGVRISQIPAVDLDTRRQLEILRDNLIKVCNEIKK